MTKRTAGLIGLVASMAVLSCGKRGDPKPPLRKTPRPLTSFRIAQLGDRLEISGIAPHLSTEGVALKAITVEVLRTDGEGDFLKLAKKRTFAVQPGEAFAEPETLPAAGTLVRVAARAMASGKLSVLTGVMALPVQNPPAPPTDVTAVVSEGGVQLKWSGKRPTPPPTLAPTPPPATPVPGTPAGAPKPDAGTPAPTPPAPAAAPAASSHPSASPPVAPPPPAPPPTPKSGFWVYRRAKAGRYERPLYAEPTPDRSYLDATAATGQEWCYIARAVVAHEPLIESVSSNEVCLTPRDITPPTVPAGLTLLVQGNTLELRWSPSPESDLAFYRVYRAGPTDGPEKIAEVPAGTSVFQDKSAAPGTTYRYTLTAVDQVGNESAPSVPLLGNLP